MPQSSASPQPSQREKLAAGIKSDRGHGVALAHLVPTPFQASGVGAIIIIAPRLGLGVGLGRLLVPAGLPYQARPGTHPSPDGRPLSRIPADGPTDSTEGGATGRPAHGTVLLGWRYGALGWGCVGSTPVWPLAH
jgi:hypothetical protein